VVPLLLLLLLLLPVAGSGSLTNDLRARFGSHPPGPLPPSPPSLPSLPPPSWAESGHVCASAAAAAAGHPAGEVASDAARRRVARGAPAPLLLPLLPA